MSYNWFVNGLIKWLPLAGVAAATLIAWGATTTTVGTNGDRLTKVEREQARIQQTLVRVETRQEAIQEDIAMIRADLAAILQELRTR